MSFQITLSLRWYFLRQECLVMRRVPHQFLSQATYQLLKGIYLLTWMHVSVILSISVAQNRTQCWSGLFIFCFWCVLTWHDTLSLVMIRSFFKLQPSSCFCPFMQCFNSFIYEEFTLKKWWQCFLCKCLESTYFYPQMLHLAAKILWFLNNVIDT